MKICDAALVLALLAAVVACGDDEETTTISGDAFKFNSGDTMISGAKVTILETGESTTTDAKGHFSFSGVTVGSQVTLRLEATSQHKIQTGTHTVPAAGLEKLTFQVVDDGVYAVMALMLGITTDEQKACQMVTTVTRIGKSLYHPGAHGEEGATVTLSPAIDTKLGPIYFNSQVQPDRKLTQTSDDGGVLYVNVPPGDYTWTATKAGTKIRTLTMKCRAGWLVNASPPWGLQVYK